MSEEIRKYINGIRNQDKKWYASAYYDHLIGKRTKEPDRGDLSYMAAQGVRMHLTDLYFRKGA